MEKTNQSRFATRPEFTPEKIEALRPDEVFVFGSNLDGLHKGGASFTAFRKFGAQWGQGVGLQGQSYAIPTVFPPEVTAMSDFHSHHSHKSPTDLLSLMKPYVESFITFASQHPDLLFYVTRIGCGVACLTPRQVAPLFRDALTLDNVRLPEDFVRALQPHVATEGKTQVYNVIVLDRSGSMSSIREATIKNVNETIVAIREAQKKHADTQEHYLTLVAFCSCKMQYIYDDTPIGDVHRLGLNDYEPCCCTPLLDAMGMTFTKMRANVAQQSDAVVVATIITDGYENASHEYDGAAIKALIEALKTEGWTFTYMGANQDAIEVASRMSIRNARNFEASDSGVCYSMASERATRASFYDRMEDERRAPDYYAMSREERYLRRLQMADEEFDKRKE